MITTRIEHLIHGKGWCKCIVIDIDYHRQHPLINEILRYTVCNLDGSNVRYADPEDIRTGCEYCLPDILEDLPEPDEVEPDEVLQTMGMDGY